VTPDSFSDDAHFTNGEAAAAAALRLAGEGADIIDVGGESTRPGYVPVPLDEEIARVLPAIERLAAGATPISVDTQKARVAERALAAGAHIVNDIRGLLGDADMARVVAAHDAGVVVMHNRETADRDIDIVADMRDFFRRAIDRAFAAGIRADRILIDPGIGFGKTGRQNLAAIARLGELRDLGFPVLLGVSRKALVGDAAPADPRARVPGTLAANLFGVLAGAAVLRVHDVAAHAQALRMLDAIRSAG
jgi:dihydropteroate synthase